MRRELCMLLLLIVLFTLSTPSALLAQDETPVSQLPELVLFADFPSRVIDIGETVSLDLNLRTASVPQVVTLEVVDLPERWQATFRGDGQIVRSAFVNPAEDATVQLQIAPPEDIAPGVYRFRALARGERAESELPIELIVEERVPGSLAFDVELPVVRGRPNTTFRFNVTLRNDGDEDLTVDLLAQAPPVFSVVFKSSGQEVTSLPVDANNSKRISVEVSSLIALIPAGTYPVAVLAQSGDTEAAVELAVEVVGQPSLTLTTPDERLSGEAEAGVETTFNLVLQNTGTAAARLVNMGSTAPSGWNVTYEPESIEAIEPGQVVEVVARVRPADKALAGDYMLTFRASPDGSAAETLEYRVTIRTSTAWGIAGVALIAVAIGAVGVAVARFGRR